MRQPKSVIIIITLLFSACGLMPGDRDSTPPTPVGMLETPVSETITEDEQTVEQPGPVIPATASPVTENTNDADADTTPDYTNVWRRIRDNLSLHRHLQDNSVQSRLNWYARHQDYLDRVAERATPYLYHIVEELEKRGMPLDLALLPVVESAFHPFAYSPSHASGIWQFIPGTGRHYGLKQSWWYDGRRDIVAATRAALDYLEKLHAEFDGDWLLALAAYNTGERNVGRAIERNRRARKPVDFWNLRLPRETRGYVPSLLAVAELVANPGKHDVSLLPIPNEPYFTGIDTGEQIDLALVAELSGLSMDEIYTLNPGFSRWATDPEGPHTILLPVERMQQFEQRLAELPENERVSWKRHVIKPGDSLSAIANRYRTSVSTIKQANSLRGNLIRVGDSLLIPSARQPLRHYTLSLDSRRYQGLKRVGSGEKFEYTVRKGDTLWDISRQYEVTVRSLLGWNNLSASQYLRPGQKLALFLDRNNDTGKSGALRVASNEQTGAVSYTVKKGDSLWLISRRFGVTVPQLMKWNGLQRGKLLMPGQELILKEASEQSTGA